MTSCIGFGLLIAVIVGGIYLYYRVQRLSKEIESPAEMLAEGDEDEG